MSLNFKLIVLLCIIFSASICCIKTSIPDTGIIGGQIAKAGQFPFIVSLQEGFFRKEHFCGGSLISDKFVITAGHCVVEKR